MDPRDRTPLSDRTMADLLREGPAMLEALRRAGLAQCIGCAMAPFETLAEAIRIYGLDPRRVLRTLRHAGTREGEQR